MSLYRVLGNGEFLPYLLIAAAGRDMVQNLLGGPPRDWAFLVRINPLGSGLTLEDLAAIVRPGLDGILIPKVNGTQDIELISNYVDVLEVAAGVTPGHVKLLVVATETPAAMIGLVMPRLRPAFACGWKF